MACLEVENVSLTYPIYGAHGRSFKSTLVQMATGGRLHSKNGNLIVEALKEVSFKLEKGDRLALLGHNGAGKSTLLKVLARIFQPTKGRVNVQGSTHCLFDIMMGMDHELNGYENIMLRGLILGLSREEIRTIVPRVEEFAELGDFMKMPLKSYSAGMKIRLAFGIITSVASEILLIDEIVNVGDAQFVERAKVRMKSLVLQSEFMVLSTHDLSMVREFCNKALWLKEGSIQSCGPVEEVLKTYHLDC
jgi:ABC-type polysaccharide/polyol phosphate transport system ATPase subunit